MSPRSITVCDLGVLADHGIDLDVDGHPLECNTPDSLSDYFSHSVSIRSSRKSNTS